MVIFITGTVEGLDIADYFWSKHKKVAHSKLRVFAPYQSLKSDFVVAIF